MMVMFFTMTTTYLLYHLMCNVITPPAHPNSVNIVEEVPVETLAATTPTRAKRSRKALPGYKASDAVYLDSFVPRKYSGVIKTRAEMSAEEYASRKAQLAEARSLRNSNRKQSRNTPLDVVMKAVGVARNDGYTPQTRLFPWKIGNNSEPKPGLRNDVLRFGIITAANDYKNRGPITQMVKASVPTETLRTVVRRGTKPSRAKRVGRGRGKQKGGALPLLALAAPALLAAGKAVGTGALAAGAGFGLKNGLEAIFK